MRKVGLALLLLVVAAGGQVEAQLRGLGRIEGTVTDESGTPLTEVTVTATLPGSAGEIAAASDGKGKWLLGGMGRGDWDVVFEKAGYTPRRAKVSLQVELARVPPIAVVMKKP
jgi:hypothetical protein